MKKMAMVFVCFFLVLSIFSAPVKATAEQEVIKLLFSSAWPPPPNVIGQPVNWFMDELEKRSNGRVKFERHWGGSFTTGPETLEHLKTGAIDLGGMCFLYNPGLTPIGMVDFGVPFGTTDARVQTQIKREFFQKTPEFQEEMQRYNIVPVIWISSPARDLITKFPVKSLEDLKGKKLGAAGNYLPKYVAAAGAVGAHAPMTEAYMMMQKGVIEGQLLHIDLIYNFKLFEVCKYFTRVGLSATTYMIFGFNKTAFDKLPQDIQQLAMEISAESDKYFYDWLEGQISTMEKKLKEAGVEFSVLPDAERAKWLKGMYYIPEYWAEEMNKKGLPGNNMMRSYIQIMKNKGHVFPPDWEFPANK